MTEQEILNSRGTKTWKIQQLLLLGKTRKEVATLMNCGYGFVQNVYAKMNPGQVRTRNIIVETIELSEIQLTNFRFNHTFGVEIESFGVSKEEVVQELTNAGIEITSEGYNHTTRTHWKLVNDSSINGSNSFEIVSPKLKGENGLRQLKTVTLILKGLDAKVNKTCGVHIHFDASEFDLQTWKRIFINYGKLETTIDSWMPKSRRGNNNYYCKSIKFDGMQNKIDSIRDNENIAKGLKAIKEKFGICSRYFKVNIDSYWRHKSIEFRQHSGSLQYEKISNWIIFLARLIEYSKLAIVKNGEWDSIKNFITPEQMAYLRNRANELSN